MVTCKIYIECWINSISTFIVCKYDYRKIPSFECNFRYVQAFLDAYRRLKQTLSQQRAPELSMEYDVHVKKPPL